MVETKASDVHITPGFPPAIRDKGKIRPMEGFPVLNSQMTREVVYGILNDDQRKRFENNQQLDFAYAIPGVARFRVNCFFQRGTVSAAFRLVPQEIPALDSLGVPQVLRELCEKPRGFVLVTGPTGSGKSTTLAAMIDTINVGHQDHILTIEDPIEFLHQHKSSIVNQREIGSDAPDFALGLRAALREDPDVILVGEMRDLETISTALTAAETGHLVFATLHTQSTAQTVDRIIDVFPPEQQGQVRTQLLDCAAGDRHAAVAANGRWQGPHRRDGGADPDPGDPQPDPRGENAPDLCGSADLRRGWDADDGRRPGPARPYRQGDAFAGRTARLGAGGAQPPARWRAAQSCRSRDCDRQRPAADGSAGGLAQDVRYHLRVPGDGPGWEYLGGRARR